MAYSTKQDVLNMIKVMRPDFEEGDINEGWLYFASVKVDSILDDFGIPQPREDINDLLKYASILFYFENASKLGQIQSQFGDVKSRQKGKTRTDYQTTAPMFFFSNGEAKNFYGLLGHETWRMEAYHLCRAYMKKQFTARTGKKFAYASYKSDDTLRGYGWDQEAWINASGQRYNEYNRDKVW